MWIKKLKDRYTVTFIAFMLVFSVIIFRLASIMIVDGESYREEAENRILKSIPLTAARGEIRDRYGRLLAGNRPSFTVQIMKNEIVDSEINEVALKLMDIFIQNGDAYVDEFPIKIDENGNYYFTYDLEIEKWKINNNIPLEATGAETYEILFERYGIEAEDPAEAQQQLLQHMSSVPVSILTWKYTDQMKKESWLTTHRITDFEITAEEAFHHAREKYYKIPETYSVEEAHRIMIIREQLNKSGYLQFQPIRIAHDVAEQTVIQIEENILDLPGVNVSVEPIRYYPEGETAAHILGTLGKISQQNEIDYFIKELGYNPSDIIGKTGIEHSFEETLKGTDGSQKVIVDSRGRPISVVEREEPVPGDTHYLTIDMNLQKKAQEVLKEVLETIQVGGTYTTQWGSNRLSGSKGPMKNATSGSVVVMDVKTGEILALANYPAYDPNLFATGISLEDWNKLLPENDRDPLAPRPQLNIALSTAIQPGSTFKMLVGIAALEQGLSPNYEIYDKGAIRIGGHSFGNWLYNQGSGTMGWQNLYEAIAQSNNFYFYSLGTGYDHGIERRLPVPMDVHKIIDYSHRFGLNDRTGIEIEVPRERSGGVPSLENKTRTIKALLKRYLERQLTAASFDDTVEPPSQERLDEIIEEIIGWTEENPSRGVIYNRLLEMGIKTDVVNLFADVIKYNYFMQASWSIADTMNFSIGQGEHSYTPLQMANFMAILANGGYRNRVSVLQKIQSYDGSVVKEDPPELIERVEMNDYNNINEVNYGMHQVTTTGTARNYFTNFPIKVAAKTGTAQRSGKIPPLDEVQYMLSHLKSFGVNEQAVYERMELLREENKDDKLYLDDAYAMREAIKDLNPKIKNADIDQFKADYDNYAWFTGFAPYENPEIAISVLIFQGGSGGYGAPIFREIVAEYMGLNLTDDNNEAIIDNRLTR